ncbi:transporter family-2 protein [Thermanaeromonas toyohensis ToBE]|uniref:Transporter family-2 protein n=1 Tax=Thermanaeromonas toyohensis ToBE TaxID=698762 RepID=A0A1W1W374_9FIRM|nr:DMT family transporter [Thermanaeromonas toyohensis]SMC00075.1 transporter family-2 protein [Thermanaeromonas toyohensis ToBE]
MLFALVLALLSGVAMAVQGSLNAALAKITGLLQATLVVHLTATITVVLLLLFPLSPGSLGKIIQAPWYLLLGGIIGVLITYGVVASIPRAGVALATTAIIVGQVTTALIIDHWGLFGLEKIPFTWWKALGLALLASGACLMLKNM